MPAAAFYDLDGTLVGTNLVNVFAFYARNDQGILKSFGRTAATIAGLPVFLATDLYSRNVFNVLFYKWYRGQSEDRLRYLSDELFEDVIKPSIYPGTLELLEKSRSIGLRQVVVTGALDITIRPLLRFLGIEEFTANRLEFADGVATGRLVPPVMASATKASWIRNYAEREGISAERLLQLCGQHERSAHAGHGRASHGHESGYEAEEHRPPARLAHH